MPKSACAFISYARRDGEAFADNLRQRLEREQPGITVWQDRARMEGGIGWWKQVTDALDSVSFLILVMTPAALQSEISRKEWRYARQAGVCVYPVKGVPDAELNFRDMPPWMRDAHFFDLESEWDTFVQHLKSPCQAPRVPHMAPDLPSGFIQRPEFTAGVLDSMLDRDRQTPKPGNTVLYGAGGIGKTTLAGSICHNEDVINAFPGGILWTTLGQKPNVIAALTEIFAALTGDRPKFVSAEDGAIEVSRRLEDRNCLMVIDDVWSPGHLRPFLRGGNRCVRLITTRQFEIATEFAAPGCRIRTPQMLRDEAIEMLISGIDGTAGDAAPFRALARRMGQWPLMLKLVRGALRQRLARGDSLEGALRYVNRALDRKGYTVFDGPGEERESGIAKTIQVSLDLLNPSDKQRCLELAVFPGDIEIPLDAAGSVWGEDDFATERLAERLDGLSLLEFDLKRGMLRLHDLMRGYFGAALADKMATHRKLIDAWGDLRALRSAYAWKWCVYHLAGAGQTDAAVRLLTDFDWIATKLVHSGSNALIQDYEYLRGSAELRTIQSSIRLAAHVVDADPSQFAGQLLGRLNADSLEARTLLDGAARSSSGVWLRPVCASLTRPGGPIIRLLSGHEGPIRDVAVSSDGRRVASASSVKDEVRLWDVGTWSELRVLSGHRKAVNAVDISSDGSVVLSGSDDCTAKVWNADTGDELFTLSGHAAAIRSVAFTRDDKHAVTGSFDRNIIVWDLATGLPTLKLTGHEDWVRAVAVSGDSRWIVSSSMDGTFRVWDFVDGTELRVLRIHQQAARALAWCPRVDSLISGADDGSIRVWNLDGSGVRTLCESGPSVQSISVTSDGRLALSLSDDGLRVWDLESSRCVATLRAPAGTPNTAAISPDGAWAVTGSHDENLRVWNLEEGAAGPPVHGHGGWVNSVAIGGNAGRAVSGGYDGSLKIWDPATGAEIHSVQLTGGAVRAVAIAGDVVISGSERGFLRVWDAGGNLLRTSDESIAINGVAITADGKRAVSGSPDGQLRIWDLESCMALRTIRAHTTSILAVAMDHTGTLALSASADGTVKCWDLTSGAEVHTLRGHNDFVRCVSIAPGCARAASGTKGGRFKIWDVAAGTRWLDIESDVGTVNGLALLAGGHHMISGTGDHTVRLWNVNTARCLAVFTADDVVTSCAIAEDSRTIIVGDASGAVHFIRIEGMLPEFAGRAT